MIKFSTNKNQLAILIDPGKLSEKETDLIIKNSIMAKVDFFFIGGSLMLDNTIGDLLKKIKSKTDIPCILYPGNSIQIHEDFDAVLFMSLLSGRNAEYLIGQQVISAPIIKKSGLQSISTGYILVSDCNLTSVAYMSQTQPIPTQKSDIILATAMAADLLGFSCIFLDGGSGTSSFIPLKTIQKVKNNITKPLIVGGGIKNKKQAQEIWNNGADIIVIGNATEENPDFILDFC